MDPKSVRFLFCFPGALERVSNDDDVPIAIVGHEVDWGMVKMVNGSLERE